MRAVRRSLQAGQKAAEILERALGAVVTFYRFLWEDWKHLRASNVLESPFAAMRPRTDAAKRYKQVANATAPI